MYLFIGELGEILKGSYEEITDIEVADTFFHTYPSFCWRVVDGVVTLKDDADDILEAHHEKEKSTRLQSLEDEALKVVRAQRGRLLAETDHYALQDVDLTEEMITYRQALRDLPATVDINNIIYPEKP
jgi:hypothetical protein